MTTVRQMQSWMSDGQHGRAIAELSQFRGDLPAEIVRELNGSAIAAVALAAIRLQELNQQRTTLYRGLLARLVGLQLADGGWGDVLPSALAIRALLGDASTRGDAIRGIDWLCGQQKDDGSLSREPIRRLPGETMVTAFVLAHLSRSSEFAMRFRIEAALKSLAGPRPLASPAVQSLIKLAIQRASASVGGQARQLVALAMAS